MTARRSDRTAAWVTGIAALVGGFLVYVALAGLGGGVDWEDRLTLDQSGELELEEIGIYLGLVVATALGAPLSAYIILRQKRALAAGGTALLASFTCSAAALIAGWVIPTTPRDPVLLPYAVFGIWFLAPFLSRLVIEQGFSGSTPDPDGDPGDETRS